MDRDKHSLSLGPIWAFLISFFCTTQHNGANEGGSLLGEPMVCLSVWCGVVFGT
jgi:hypothetical protein